MKTFRRMQHSMRANLPDVRDPRRRSRSGSRRTRCRGSSALRELGELDDERARRRSSATSRREVEAAIEPALADEDASADDLLPSVFARAPPLSGAARAGRARARLRRRDPRGARPRARGRPRRDRDRRGHRPRRRPLPRDRGPLRALRRRADPRHAADRERLRRLRHRRRAHRPAARSSSSSSPTSPASRSTRS